MVVKMHKVTIAGQSMTQACEREWDNYCRVCAPDERGVSVPPMPSLDEWLGSFFDEPEPVRVPVVPEVRWEVVKEFSPGKWTRVLGPTTYERAGQWWVLTYRDGGPDMRVREVAASV